MELQRPEVNPADQTDHFGTRYMHQSYIRTNRVDCLKTNFASVATALPNQPVYHSQSTYPPVRSFEWPRPVNLNYADHQYRGTLEDKRHQGPKPRTHHAAAGENGDILIGYQGCCYVHHQATQH